MKFRFKPANKRYTILIVPEGTSPVFRFKMRFTLMLSMLITAAVIILLLLILAMANRSHSNRIVSLEAELTSSTDRLQSTVDDKEQAIDKLLTELLDLSEKSKTIESKMLELETLEAELKSITSGNRQANGTNTAVANPSAQALDQNGGVGGESIPLSDEDVRALIAETKESITISLNEMPDLQKRLKQTKLNVEKYKEMMMILPTYWPTDSTRITSHFGKRSDPFSNRLTSHNGLDIGGNSGDPVYAAANGKVTDTGYSSARGNFVTVSHPSGLQTIYMHLKQNIAAKGDTVKQGDTIGLLGSTGRSTGPHLHIEVIKGGVPVDPLNYLTIPGEDDKL
ncbi:murein DD-endopeptidase MepM/ murein hydrolase activator NlpD [Fontibacillus phaseoli]|uniref:Murein DD-endopeptidase MepM/ murein hydrolase activator NlpD n=1 Tax=Fontibacillus phaseoli TaxID=1416533 RepID=A0A369BLE2_9BACL|nr:M23 family metallopeptidase [Fontibacillus phaseoli]RCX20514.1 murein DD-endopeptidase MepM/ murein hydrolase activator NlpD [Fontibacillus phaseoli]